jgi:hypothetical protein
MATISTTAKPAIPFINDGKHFLLEATIDFDNIDNFNSGDTVQALAVMEGMRILGTELEVVTASDAATSATVDLGDGTNTYGSGIDLKTVAITYGTTSGRYTENDTIDVTPTYTGATTVKGKVIARAWGVLLD